VRLAVAAGAARAAGVLSRRAGRGGTSLPGKVLLRLEPHAIGALASRLPQGTAVISATNGKTTTAAMVAEVLEGTGTRLVHNRQGANMAGGVASALLTGDPAHSDLGLFEVDEFWLDRVVPELRPRALLLGNLFRDQLDRFGELEIIADRWAAVTAAARDTQLVLNADDPLVADLGVGAADGRVSTFGVEDDAVALPGLPHATDAKHCRRCGRPYVYDTVFLGHLGRYHCPTGDSVRPVPDVAAEDVVLDGVRAARFTLRTPEGRAPVTLPLPGLYNVYNALGAAALCRALGVPLPRIAAGLSAVSPAFGRAETVRTGGRDLTILLVKNPAGANEVVRTLALEAERAGDLDVLGVLNDRTADGKDVSWVWDADFEVLAPRLRRVVCAGTRAAELAVRLKYAGVPEARLEVQGDLRAAVERIGAGEGPAYALPTYTAMLELRELLHGRALA
jgi:lipid II isoglutaminyl synthase (glutamine-hydrolysing)